MKKEEICIGDWFRMTTDPAPFRITDIETDNPCCFVYGDDGFKVDAASLDPIPLTRELMDLNFGKKDEYGNRVYSIDFIDIYVSEIPEGIWDIRIDEVEMNGLPEWRMFASYVHELQHALRLAGVDKEIEL